MNEDVKKILRKVLSKGAAERLARVKLVKPELAEKIENYIVQLYLAGRLKEEISEKEMIMILENLSSKKDYRIIR